MQSGQFWKPPATDQPGQLRICFRYPHLDKDTCHRFAKSRYIWTLGALCLLGSKLNVGNIWINSAKRLHHSISTVFAGVEKECRRIDGDIFIYWGGEKKSLLNDVAEYCLLFLSLTRPPPHTITCASPVETWWIGSHTCKTKND